MATVFAKKDKSGFSGTRVQKDGTNYIKLPALRTTLLEQIAMSVYSIPTLTGQYQERQRQLIQGRQSRS